MIKRAENGDVSALLSFLSDDAVSTRIKANLSVYKCDYPFAEFWAQYGENGEVCAVMSEINGAAALTFSDSADKQEIASLLNFIPFSSLMLDYDKAERLSLKTYRSGDVLMFGGNATGAYENTADCADMKKVFSLIKENEGASVARLDYLEWLSDFTFKNNRSAARLKALHIEDSLVSAAMTSAETCDSAIISGVFTSEQMRKRGYGEQVLLSLTKSLVRENKKVYILTADEKMTSYYEKRGFIKTGRWSEGINNV